MLKDQTQHPLPGAAQTTLSRGTPLEALLSVLMAHSEEQGAAQGRNSEFEAGMLKPRSWLPEINRLRGDAAVLRLFLSCSEQQRSTLGSEARVVLV